jgi:hypothetical protein
VEDKMSPVRERYGDAFWRARHEAWVESEGRGRSSALNGVILTDALRLLSEARNDGGELKAIIDNVRRGGRLVAKTGCRRDLRAMARPYPRTQSRGMNNSNLPGLSPLWLISLAMVLGTLIVVMLPVSIATGDNIKSSDWIGFSSSILSGVIQGLAGAGSTAASVPEGLV